MEQPEGFVLKGKEDYVCKLKKSLYGLKQAPRQCPRRRISSNGRSRFVCGPIDLKFEGEIFNSLISNLNGGDRIWSSGRLLFQSVNSASLSLISSHPGSSDIQL
ncbi:hypothetical protein AAG906_037245 [Vitis piasezkii]